MSPIKWAIPTKLISFVCSKKMLGLHQRYFRKGLMWELGAALNHKFIIVLPLVVVEYHDAAFYEEEYCRFTTNRCGFPIWRRLALKRSKRPSFCSVSCSMLPVKGSTTTTRIPESQSIKPEMPLLEAASEQAAPARSGSRNVGRK